MGRHLGLGFEFLGAANCLGRNLESVFVLLLGLVGAQEGLQLLPAGGVAVLLLVFLLKFEEGSEEEEEGEGICFVFYVLFLFP
jgi:hypothetical protein